MSVFLIICAVVSLVLGAVILFAVQVFLKKSVASSVGSEQGQFKSRIAAADKEIEETLKYADSYVSRGQYDTIVSQLEAIKIDVDKERNSLQLIEKKLEGAQKAVEEKESFQQDLKTSKEEDELKLKELLENYEEISTESISLEQKLASSMKNLDQIMSELTLTADQRAVLEDLQRVMTGSGSTLRDLLVEYETLNERLNMLSQQLVDLEDEYTKLVERQLGE